MRTCVASLSWYDFRVCLHCSVYLYFILLCVRLLHCVDVPLVVCPSSWWLTFGLFPALGCREYCRCVFVGVRIFNSFGHIPKSGFVGSCLFYVFNLFLAQEFSKTHYRPPRVWERLYGTYDTSLDVPGSRSEYERLQIAVMRPRCSRGGGRSAPCSCCSFSPLHCPASPTTEKRRLWNLVVWVHVSPLPLTGSAATHRIVSLCLSFLVWKTGVIILWPFWLLRVPS